MINIRELASLANVSPSAVSIALRGRTGISEETRHRILKLATQHGYRPNPMVSALMSQVGTRLRRRVESIVGILSYMDLAHYPVHSTPHLYLQGINHAAEGAGYLVENFTLANDGHGSVPLARMLDARCIRGLIVHVKQVDFDQIALDRNRFAFVALGVPVKGDAVDFVCNDHGHSVQLAIRNLRRLGYRRLGLALDGNRPEHAESAMLSAMLLEQYRAGEKHTIPPLLSKDWGRRFFSLGTAAGSPMRSSALIISRSTGCATRACVCRAGGTAAIVAGCKIAWRLRTSISIRVGRASRVSTSATTRWARRRWIC